MTGLFILWLACSPAQDSKQAPFVDPPPQMPAGEAVPQGPPKGEKNPPIPADNPAWEDDRPGFRSNFFFYGERSWADVKMRVAGHIAMVERDRARLAAISGDPDVASDIYAALAERLLALELGGADVAVGIRDRLVAAAQRDAALLRGISEGAIPEDLQQRSGVSGLRARLLHWSLNLAHRPDAEQTRAWVVAHGEVKTERADLKLDGFSDFDDRHKLRLRLFDAYLDAADPIGFNDPWGYWRADEIAFQLRALMMVAGMVAPLKGGKPAGVTGLPPMKAVRLWHRPSVVAAHLKRPGAPTGFTVDGLGSLPTGDSLIDVAGEPGPMAIGTLQRLGLDDEAHREWLRLEAAALNQALTIDPSTVAGRLQKTTAALDAHGHGSRYYNIKAARNAAVRQLAARRAFHAARDVLAMNRPLHHQDWACPNRDGILLAIEGRLLASAGDPEAGAVLAKARASAEDFLRQVQAAEQAGR